MNDPTLALTMVGNVWRYWWYRAHLLEGYQHTIAALDADAGSDARLRLRALEAASYLAYRRADITAMRAHCDDALRLAHETQDRVAEGIFVNQLSLIANAEGDYERASRLLENSVGLLDGDGYSRYPLGNLGLNALREGDASRAVAIFREVLEMDLSCGDEHHLCGVEAWLGLALSLDGRAEEAMPHARRSLEIAGQLGADEAAAMALLAAARLGVEGSPEPAATALGAADGILERADAQRREMVPGTYQYVSSKLESRLGADSFARAYGVGRRLSLEDAVVAGLASLD